MREIKFRVWYSDRKSSFYIYGSQALRLMGYFGQEGYAFEQYTGLKDADGVEIYEGDILKDFDENGIVGFVEYDESYGEYSCGDDSLYEATRDCVVIGNIHENQ